MLLKIWRMNSKKIEEKYEKAKNEIELKDRERNEQVEEINILRDNNQSMVTQIAENVMMEKEIRK